MARTELYYLKKHNHNAPYHHSRLLDDHLNGNGKHYSREKMPGDCHSLHNSLLKETRVPYVYKYGFVWVFINFLFAILVCRLFSLLQPRRPMRWCNFRRRIPTSLKCAQRTNDTDRVLELEGIRATNAWSECRRNTTGYSRAFSLSIQIDDFNRCKRLPLREATICARLIERVREMWGIHFAKVNAILSS